MSVRYFADEFNGGFEEAVAHAALVVGDYRQEGAVIVEVFDDEDGVEWVIENPGNEGQFSVIVRRDEVSV